MSRRSGFFILVVSLSALGCGETSRDAPSAGAGGVSQGRGGASGSGGSGTHPGGAGGRAFGGAGGTATDSGGVAGRVAGGAGTGGDALPGGGQFAGSAIYTRVQRLTNRQWENAVTDILRFSEPHALSARFAPPPSGVTDFDNNENVLFVDSQRFLDFESGAEAAASLATASAEALAAIDAGNDAETFIRVLGRRAFRRPLTREEEAKYQTLFSFGERLYGAGFANGAALVIRGLLQSPHFLYRTELGPAGGPLDPYELASKLSFWLLGTTPSDSLLDSAAAGELADLGGLEATARQMLEDPRAVAVMRDFHGQLLRIRNFETINKAGVPEYDASINPELALASSAFFDLVFQKNLGLRGLLTSNQAYVGPGLARFYGLDAPASGLELRDLGPSRSGYFMQVPFLMLGQYDTEPDSIRRGTELLLSMLCEPIGRPAIDFPPLPKLQPGETNRQRVTQHTAGCGVACHAAIDPLGFAFENFDGLGRERATDNGQPIDTTGSHAFVEGVKSFADANELMQIMAESPQVHTCYSKSVTGYALGRDVVENDRPLVEGLAKVSLAHSLKEVAVALVRDPAFTMRKGGQP